MDESNHEMLRMLSQQMGTIFNPLIQNTTQTNQQMTTQMTRIADFFGVSQAPRHLRREHLLENQGATLEEDPTINQFQQNACMVDVTNQVVRVEPPRVEQLVPIEREPRVLMVNRNKDADEVIRQVQHNDLAMDNNLAAMVERIMARNGVNAGLHRPNYMSPLS